MENFIRIDKRKRGFKWVVSSLKEGKMLLKVNIDNQKKLLTSVDCYYWTKYYGESGIWFEQVDFVFDDDYEIIEPNATLFSNFWAKEEFEDYGWNDMGDLRDGIWYIVNNYQSIDYQCACDLAEFWLEQNHDYKLRESHYEDYFGLYRLD